MDASMEKKMEKSSKDNEPGEQTSEINMTVTPETDNSVAGDVTDTVTDNIGTEVNPSNVNNGNVNNASDLTNVTDCIVTNADNADNLCMNNSTTAATEDSSKMDIDADTLNLKKDELVETSVPVCMPTVELPQTDRNKDSVVTSSDYEKKNADSPSNVDSGSILPFSNIDKSSEASLFNVDQNNVLSQGASSTSEQKEHTLSNLDVHRSTTGGENINSGSDTDEDSDSSTVSDAEGAPESVKVCKVEVEEVKPEAEVIRTKGEMLPEDLPPLEDLKITVPEDETLLLLGKVSSVVGILVIIQSCPDTPALNEETVLFHEDRQSFGKVFEIFGPVSKPFYSVRFNNLEAITKANLKIGDEVYCAPNLEEITQYVFLDQLRKMKGSDASWKDNNEPPSKHMDYSDDESERRSKAKKRNKNVDANPKDEGEKKRNTNNSHDAPSGRPNNNRNSKDRRQKADWDRPEEDRFPPSGSVSQCWPPRGPPQQRFQQPRHQFPHQQSRHPHPRHSQPNNQQPNPFTHMSTGMFSPYHNNNNNLFWNGQNQMQHQMNSQSTNYNFSSPGTGMPNYNNPFGAGQHQNQRFPNPFMTNQQPQHQPPSIMDVRYLQNQPEQNQ